MEIPNEEVPGPKIMSTIDDKGAPVLHGRDAAFKTKDPQTGDHYFKTASSMHGQRGAGGGRQFRFSGDVCEQLRPYVSEVPPDFIPPDQTSPAALAPGTAPSVSAPSPPHSCTADVPSAARGSTVSSDWEPGAFPSDVEATSRASVASSAWEPG